MGVIGALPRVNGPLEAVEQGKLGEMQTLVATGVTGYQTRSVQGQTLHMRVAADVVHPVLEELLVTEALEEVLVEVQAAPETLAQLIQAEVAAVPVLLWDQGAEVLALAVQVS